MDTLDKGWDTRVECRFKGKLWNGDAAAAGITTVNCRLSSIDRIALRRRMALAMLPRGAQVSYDCRRAPAPLRAPLCTHVHTGGGWRVSIESVWLCVMLFFGSFSFFPLFCKATVVFGNWNDC